MDNLVRILNIGASAYNLCKSMSEWKEKCKEIERIEQKNQKKIQLKLEKMKLESINKIDLQTKKKIHIINKCIEYLES